MPPATLNLPYTTTTDRTYGAREQLGQREQRRERRAQVALDEGHDAVGASRRAREALARG